MPDELKALNKGQGPVLSFARGVDTLAPAFEIVIHFATTMAESLVKLKRDRAAAEDEEELFITALPKRVKVEQKVKVEQGSS